MSVAVADALEVGQVLAGPLFSEPMRVVTVGAAGPDFWELGLVGQQSGQFSPVTLDAEELATLKAVGAGVSYGGDGGALRLGMQAHKLGIAYEFDPHFALSLSRVDPLPHQLEAVYHHLLKLPSVRFLLADDAGAGKTIMAGLLIRELKLRGLAERIAVVCPANLTYQWQRELGEKFDERFVVIKGSDVREQAGVNEWLDRKQVITSLDLAKRDDILPGLRQARWNLVIVDEAHRMSAPDADHKTQRYRLGEILRDTTEHILLLTATPHKGDPENFALFLQLLDRDAYADVKSINRAMEQRRAPFYLRRTKEAMVYFPERQADGEWAAAPVFTKRITRTAGFEIAGAELELYEGISRLIRQQSRRAAEEEDTPRARAVGFLMTLYQRRLASSARAIQRSLGNRARRLADNLQRAQSIAAAAPGKLPDLEDFEEMTEEDRVQLENRLDAVSMAERADEVRAEIGELQEFAAQAQAVEDAGGEAKLGRLGEILREQGFFERPEQRLLIFTEFKDTLDYLTERLADWGFRVGQIHGGMRVGSAAEPGSRLFVEQQFRNGEIQALVATEAAGEGINLQCCHILFNYDIPWNPNRLEQRMGRIHRYGQANDCLIFNFVAANTIEGQVLQRLLDKLQEIRDALDDDAVFNVVGEILPATQVEQVFRDYFAGRLGNAELEDRLLRDIDESRFRDICQTALEGLATRQLNLELLVEQRAQTQERRIVPETIARFMGESAAQAGLRLRPARRDLPHTFDAGPIPTAVRRHAPDPPGLAASYGRITTDRETAKGYGLEWVTPGHPLLEALREYSLAEARPAWASGACFYSLAHQEPARLDFYRAQAVDGMGKVVREKLFAVELTEGGEPRLVGPEALGNMTPAATSAGLSSGLSDGLPSVLPASATSGLTDGVPAAPSSGLPAAPSSGLPSDAPSGLPSAPPSVLPGVAELPEVGEWLYHQATRPFLEEARAERAAEVGRIADHVELSLTELMVRADGEIGRAYDEKEQGVAGAEGRLAMAEQRHSELGERRARRREELDRQGRVTLQGVARLTSVLVLPHPEGEAPEIGQLRPSADTEMTAMRVVMDYERGRGCEVWDVHGDNLGYDVTSRHLRSGELRLIEIKGLAAATGDILLTPNERRVAEDRRDCYWLYVVTNCAGEPQLQTPIADPAQFPWHEESKVQHYRLSVDAMTQPMRIREEGANYGV